MRLPNIVRHILELLRARGVYQCKRSRELPQHSDAAQPDGLNGAFRPITWNEPRVSVLDFK
jgi:hypothetical protein